MGRTTVRVLENDTLRRGAAVLLVTVVLLSMFLAFVQMSQTTLIQSLTQQNNEFVQQVDAVSGTLLEIIHNTAMQMFYSRSLTRLRTMDSLTDAERIAGLRDLGNWVSGSTILSSALIYNSRTDTMYTSGGGYTPHASKDYPDRSAYELMASRERHGSAGPVKRHTAAGDTYSFLFFERNVPDSGALLLNVRAHWFEHQLLGLPSGHRSAIVYSDGEIMLTGDEELSSQVEKVWPALMQRVQAGERHGFILEPGGKSGWMYYQLQSLGVYYLSAFETDELVPGLARVRRFTLFMLGAVSVVLAAGAFYTLMVLYRPLQAIREAFRKAGRGHESMVEQVDRLLESQREQHLSRQMEMLLSGEEAGLLSYPLSLILVDHADPSAVRTVVEAAAALPSLTAKALFGCAVLVSGSAEPDILDLCLALSSQLDCRCLYTEPRNSAVELQEGKVNLLDVWQMRFLYPGQQVLSEKLSAAFLDPVDFSTKDIAPLTAALRSGNLAEARSAWKELFNRIRHAKFHDFSFFVGFLLKNLNELQEELGLERGPDNIDFLHGMEDIAALHNLLDDSFQAITAKQGEKRKTYLCQLAERVNARIAAGYADGSLSAQAIADEMGLNAAYLGRLYRECTGMSIADAIKQARIEEAKKLLTQTSAPVKAIAEKVGFANQKYFFVVFKEMVGMTPKEFQEQARS